MKKITFFALLVLAGMIFVAPALKAQEAPAAGEDAQVQEAQAPEAQASEGEEAEKKANAIAILDDDDQTGNFFSTFDIEGLGAFFGVSFDTGNPVITTSHTEKGDDDEDEPTPPLSKSSLY